MVQLFIKHHRQCGVVGWSLQPLVFGANRAVVDGGDTTTMAPNRCCCNAARKGWGMLCLKGRWRMDSLSVAEQTFCDVYLQTGNGAQAFLMGFPDRVVDSSRRSERARRILRRKRIVSRLAEMRREYPAPPPPVDASPVKAGRRKRRSIHDPLTFRHEAFAQALVRCGSLAEAYQAAYPDSEAWNASRRNSYGRDLSARPHIAHRIAQLQSLVASGGIAALSAPAPVIRPATVPPAVADLRAVAAVAFSEAADPEVRLIALRTLTALLAYQPSGQVPNLQITITSGPSIQACAS
jgi:hypothetical protein